MRSTVKLKKCLTCGEPIKGRSDKKFCDDACRSSYNNELNSDRSALMRRLNNTLRKNRRILQDLIPKAEGKIVVPRKKLSDKGFDFTYHTHTLSTKAGSTYIFCYEFGYLPLENELLMLVQRSETN